MKQTILVCDWCGKHAVGQLVLSRNGQGGGVLFTRDGCAGHLYKAGALHRDVLRKSLKASRKIGLGPMKLPRQERRGPTRVELQQRAVQYILKYASSHAKNGQGFTSMDVLRTYPNARLTKWACMKGAQELLKAKKLRAEGKVRDRKLFPAKAA